MPYPGIRAFFTARLALPVVRALIERLREGFLTPNFIIQPHRDFFFFIIIAAAAPATATAPTAAAEPEPEEVTLISYSAFIPSAVTADTFTVPSFIAVRTPFSSMEAISGLFVDQVTV